MRVLGINSVFHDPAAALVIDGAVAAAAEEERFSRRKHGKRPVAFSAWEQPAAAARWCLAQGGISAADVDLIGFSYDPGLVRPPAEMGLDDPWDDLRTMYAAQAPLSSSPRRCPGWIRTGPASCATTSRTRPRPGSRCPAPGAASWSATAAVSASPA